MERTNNNNLLKCIKEQFPMDVSLFTLSLKPKSAQVSKSNASMLVYFLKMMMSLAKFL
ncbi:hypothetical protein BLOT_006101, partial [Blomia tropicalis]